MMTSIDGLTITKRLAISNLGVAALVRCDSSDGFDKSRNILLLDSSDRVLWQVAPAVASHGAIGYSAIALGEKGELLAYGSNGYEYSIDTTTGAILSRELVR